MKAVDENAFKQALARFPAGVTVVTTDGGAGGPWGFTASSFTSLSLHPPLVLVCLARDAECLPAFEQCSGFAVNILGPDDTDLAVRFATKGADKFFEGDFAPGVLGHPTLKTAIASAECELETQYPGGDHVILIGRVVDARSTTAEPVVYLDRAFRFLGGPVRAC